mgnify:CR=1 FL=1
MFSCLGIITARKGSKGIPGKNKKILHKKPLLKYTCDIAKKCKFITKIITTTDCKKIQSLSNKYGVEAPFLRPKKLATDTSHQEDAILHTIKWYFKNRKVTFDYICLLEPTSPFRNLSTLNKAFKILHTDKKLDGVFSITKNDLMPQLLKQKSENNLMASWLKGIKYDNRQAYPIYYKLTSSVVIIKLNYFMKNKFLISKKSYALEVDQVEGIMLDNRMDFFIAQQLMKENIHTPNQLKKYTV